VGLASKNLQKRPVTSNRNSLREEENTFWGGIAGAQTYRGGVKKKRLLLNPGDKAEPRRTAWQKNLGIENQDKRREEVATGGGEETRGSLELLSCAVRPSGKHKRKQTKVFVEEDRKRVAGVSA